MAREIPLTQGRVAIVDDADYEWLSQWKWTLHKGSRPHLASYAYRHEYKNRRFVRRVHMHRLIMDAPPAMEVDHINGDGLDNRRVNLRLATRQQNSWNRQPSCNGSSVYRGVKRHPMGGWAASVFVNGKAKSLGVFDSEIEAAKEYDAAAVYHYGEFARTNFDPPTTPDIDPLRQARSKRNTSSVYRGVSFQIDMSRWTAKVGHKGKLHHLGSFESEIDAARAYDRAALKFYGEKARLNFPAEHLNPHQSQQAASNGESAA